MSGLENIAAHNGWAMAAVGISIVFSGLILLSFVISQLHRILDIIEKGYDFTQKKKNNGKQVKPACPVVPMAAPADQTHDGPGVNTVSISEEIIQNYRMLAGRIGDPFSLPKLLDFAEKRGLSRPYSTVTDLIKSEIIIPDGKGFFTWKL